MLLKKYSDFGGGKKNLIQSFCHDAVLFFELIGTRAFNSMWVDFFYLLWFRL
jgi:hypothetical protein